jgi:hypothetical protein
MNGYAVTASEKYAEESDVQRKVKRPGFLARWFLKKLMEGAEWEKRQNQNGLSDIKLATLSRQSINSLTISNTPNIDQPDRAIQFTIYNANGGRIVETRRYDRQKDRSVNGLYVITGEQDFGKEIDKIITMEALK